MNTRTFTHRFIPSLNRDVFRLGLACNYGLDARGFEHGLERGIDYIFFTQTRTGHLLDPVRNALAKNRERYVVATGPSFVFTRGGVRRGAEKLLKKLRTDYIDVYQLFWLGRTSFATEATLEELVRLREEGKVRAIGVSLHDRKRAGELAEASPLDMLMVRYNAAHPGAERDIFPRLERRHPMVVTFTATAWRKLLKAPSAWTGPVMSASDCYRFCLSSPHVDVTLSGPANIAQLDEAMTALSRGPLSVEEDAWMRAFGSAVHG